MKTYSNNNNNNNNNNYNNNNNVAKIHICCNNCSIDSSQYEIIKIVKI